MLRTHSQAGGYGSLSYPAFFSSSWLCELLKEQTVCGETTAACPEYEGSKC
jgi:hypothetical protein